VLLALTGYEWGLLLAAVAFIVFALVVALVVPRSRPTFPSQYLGWFIAGCIVLFAVQMTAVVLLAEVGEAHETAAHEPEGDETEPTGTEPTETEPTDTTPTETEPPQADAAAGKTIFVEQDCGGCHTLADAGTNGTVGPNLDESQPPSDLVVERVTNGMGVMPSFKDQLTPEEIENVAAYVSSGPSS
jgi:cytochrome c6